MIWALFLWAVGLQVPKPPERIYLKAHDARLICAPYGNTREPNWSCVEASEAVRLILKDPPDCGSR